MADGSALESRIVEFPDGVAVCGKFPDEWVVRLIAERAGSLALTIADPPYGNILDEHWDRINVDDQVFCEWMFSWTEQIAELSAQGAALYVWGGIGRGREGSKLPFRPFFRYVADVERRTPFHLSTLITWRKRRAYGVQWGYLFAREELAYLVLGDPKKPRRFAVPLLDKLRGYAGYNKRYPAKSAFLRRTNIWDDVTEILRGKKHVAQKAQRLMEIPIEVHTEPGDWVLDPFAGHGTTAHAARKLGRRWIVIESDVVEFGKMVDSLRSPA